jgi:predicted XRE-type DNA-binding protein
MKSELEVRKDLTPEYVEEMAPKKLTDQHKYIAMLLAQGITQRQIIKLTGLTGSRISVLTNCQIMREEVGMIREKLFEKMTSDQAFERMGRKAERELELILDDETSKQGHKLRAIELSLDRKYGKPRQEIIHQGSLLRDILEELKDKKTSVIEIESKEVVKTEEPEEEPKEEPVPLDDPHQQWLKENLE